MLPFSQDSDTGDSVLAQGMALNVLCAPLHKVRPDLPIDREDVILRNDLAGNRAWANSCLHVKSTPLVKGTR